MSHEATTGRLPAAAPDLHNHPGSLTGRLLAPLRAALGVIRDVDAHAARWPGVTMDRWWVRDRPLDEP